MREERSSSQTPGQRAVLSVVEVQASLPSVVLAPPSPISANGQKLQDLLCRPHSAAS